MSGEEKILFKVKSLGIGGVERLTIDILNNLTLPLKKIVLLLENREDNDLLWQINKDIEIVYLKPEWLEKKIKLIKELKKKKKIYKIIYGILLEIEKIILRKNINDYIRKNNVRLFVDYATSCLKYIHKIGNKNLKKIIWIHLSNDKISTKRKKRYIKRLNNYDKIVVICNEMKEEMLKEAPHLRDKTEIIYNFIDIEMIKEKSNREFNLEDRELRKYEYCMMLGRIVDIKDHITALKAFKLLSEKGVKEKLYIIGDGSGKKNLKKFIIENKLEKQVFLLGSRENPYNFLKHAKLFIHTSKVEGFGLVLVEAGACNVPVISSRYKVGAKEILENGKNGLLFEVGNERELAQKIELLLENNELREGCKENFQKSLFRFSKEKILNEYKKIFMELCSRNEDKK